MWITFLTFSFILVCVLLILFILAQKPKGGGLSGAFGGAGGGGAVFGSKAGDALTWLTVAGFVFFLLIAIALVYATRDDVEETVAPASQGIEVEDREAEPTDPGTPPPGTPDLDPGDIGLPEGADDAEEAPPEDPPEEVDPDAPAPAPELQAQPGAEADTGATDEAPAPEPTEQP